MSSVIVIGAGLAGMISAIRLAETGISVTLIAKGLGGLPLSQGTVDILGYSPDRVTAPLEAIAAKSAFLEQENYGMTHPYAVIGAAQVKAGVDYFATQVGSELLVGDPARNYQLPTALGGIRPTALAQPSMVAGDLKADEKVALIGFRRLKDFHPALVAQNLSRAALPDGGQVQVRHMMLELAAVTGDVDSSAVIYARAFDDQGFRVRLAGELKPRLKKGEKVGMPAIMGFRDRHAWTDLTQKLGTEVFEIPLPPPGVPGLRLNDQLWANVKRLGIRIVNGNAAFGYRKAGQRLTGIEVATAGAPRVYKADSVLYAPGGLESGAIAMDSYGEISETLFGLPLALPDAELIHGNFQAAEQPIFRVGLGVDAQMRVTDAAGEPVYENLYAAGGILGGANRMAEKSGEGIALGSAIAATDAIGKELS